MTERKISQKRTRNDLEEKFIPQEDYLQSLYAITQHWLSDVKFFEDELNFFRLLIDKHLLLLIDSRNIENTRAMVSHVIDLEKDRVAVYETISLHNQHLADLLENPFVQKTPGYREEHAKLEVEFPAFVKKFRAVKAEVFKLTEKVIHSERVKKVIDWG